MIMMVIVVVVWQDDYCVEAYVCQTLCLALSMHNLI